jgi:SAM-dependent methyltransferase
MAGRCEDAGILFEDRSRAESFGSVAQLYDSVRPSYPAELVDALLEPADGAGRGSRVVDVLDVGCGTGIAGALLAARGCAVLGVEVDHRMAELARAKGLSVEEAPFERWDDAGRRFDLVTAAQAWHWVDPALGAEKAARVLRDHGRIGLFWNLGDPSPDVLERLAPIYSRLEPELEDYSVVLGGRSRSGRDARTRSGAASGDLRRSGRFDDIVERRFPWRRRYTTAGWLGFLRTHSDHHVLPPDRQDRLLSAVGEAIDAAGGSFEVRYDAVLVSARRR